MAPPALKPPAPPALPLPAGPLTAWLPVNMELLTARVGSEIRIGSTPAKRSESIAPPAPPPPPPPLPPGPPFPPAPPTDRLLTNQLSATVSFADPTSRAPPKEPAPDPPSRLAVRPLPPAPPVP